MCPRCLTYKISPHTGTGLCESCSYCETCRDYMMVKDPDGTFGSRRCHKCRCSGCGSLVFKRRALPGDPRNEYERLTGRAQAKIENMCDKCFNEKFADRICRVCKAQFSAVMLRGHKKPTLCASCVFGATRDGMNRRTHYCFFCTKKATTTYGSWVVCKDHGKVKACLQGTCTPGTLCRRCEVRMAEDRRVEALRRTAATLYNHEQNDGECFTDCRACAEIRMLEIKFTSPLTFWPPPGERPNPPLGLSERRTNRSNRYLSVEIEVAGLNRPQRKDLLMDVVRKWQGSIVHDGSLPAGGFEINTAPAAGDYFTRQVDEICTALRDAEAFVNNKCGLHVHADARDYSYNDLRKLFLYYEKTEPVLIQMQPYTRGMQNVYCKPVGKQLADAVRNLTLPEFFKKQKGMSLLKKGVMGGVYQDGYGTPIELNRPPRHDHYAREYGTPHYHGMGVHSWFFRGTIELRFHGGTIVARKIVDWATLWGHLLDRALSLTEAQIAGITDAKAEVIGVAPTARAKAYVITRLESYAAEYKAKGVAV